MVVFFYTIFRVPDSEKIKNKMLQILREISKKDETFVWGISPNGKYISIMSENEKKAWARGYWIKNKMNLPKKYLEKFVFKVIKIEEVR